MKDKRIVDLHTHTTYSDGSLSPVELIDRAAENGVKVLSITDHDTLSAYDDRATWQRAKEHDITLIPGVEISSNFQEKGVHILGLFIDPKSGYLKELLNKQNSYRLQYALKVGQMLAQDGWNIDLESIHSGKNSITKAHIAENIVSDARNEQKMAEHFNEPPSRGEFIEEMMNEGKPYFIKRQSLTPKMTIDAIHKAKGLAILAHPIASLYEDMSADMLDRVLEEHDFDALEAFYYYHDQSKGGVRIEGIDQMTKLAKKYHLAISPGSDYHGPNPFHGRQVEVGFKGFSRKPSLKFYHKLQLLSEIRLHTNDKSKSIAREDQSSS